MNLVIDVGNTTVKCAVFKDQVIHHVTRFGHEQFIDLLKELLNQYSIQSGIISSVGKLGVGQVKFVKDLSFVIELTHTCPLPFKNQYSTPSTLGLDRLALAAAAIKNYNGHNVLVIDAGTCITYDFINHKAEYLGGAISPGLRLRYAALNTFTANLPLLQKEKPKNLVGDSTSASIHSGVVNGVVMEIDGAIEAYTRQYRDLTVILTGGDSKFLLDQLKNSIFANSNFLLEGLNHILEFNTNQ